MSRFKAMAFFFTTLLSRRGFSSSLSSSSSAIATTKKLPNINFVNRVDIRYKRVAIEEAQKALREYLHSTKSLPFVVAELIANNSLFSLSNLFSKIHFSVRTFPASFRRTLRYDPINEFEFFCESIGIDYREVHRFLPPKTYFFSQDSTVINATCALSQFGFPWNRIGELCAEDLSALRRSPIELTERLCGLKERYGFDNLSVVGIILAFPHLLSSEGGFGCEDEIFNGLKRVFVEFDVKSCVEGNVDAWYEVCRKVRVFYDLGCEKRTSVELMCENKEHFLKCPKEVLSRKVEYFCKFGVEKTDVGILFLQRPGLLSLDLETPAMSVLGFLEHFGLKGRDLKRFNQKYGHILGRNGMANLPSAMKALDLHIWCFNKIKSSNGQLLETYAISFPDEGIDKEFVDAWKAIESLKCYNYTKTKMEFLRGIGFGENILTMKVLNRLTEVGSDLQERFDHLVHLGFEHSKLCLMVQKEPRILNQSTERLEEKLNFWCRGMGLSKQFLAAWPKYLHYDLNIRIKRRCVVYFWLRDMGLCTTYHSIQVMIDSSEKRFVERLYKIHPAAPKHYFESF